MDKTIAMTDSEKTAYDTGYAHGINGVRYNNSYGVFSERARVYAEGFKDGKHARKQNLLKMIKGVQP